MAVDDHSWGLYFWGITLITLVAQVESQTTDSTTTVTQSNGSQQQDVATEKYSKSGYCLISGCIPTEQTSHMRSNIECMSACSLDVTCRGSVLNGSKCHFLNDVCFMSGSCSTDAVLPAYEKTACQNGGHWNTSSSSCVCNGGWIGPTCEKQGSSCLELFKEGYPPEFYHTELKIRPETGAPPQTVYCSLYPDGSALTYIMRSTGKENHRRNWTEYVEGYTINDGNIWLGLENMVAMSKSSGNDVVGVSVNLRSDISQRVFSLMYTDFAMDDSSKSYSYNVSLPPSYGNSGDLGTSYDLDDIFGPSKGAPFSTFDKENDLDSSYNCADRAGTGWWFTTCDNWQTVGSDRINPLGWTAEAMPSTIVDDAGLLGLPGLDFESPQLNGTFLVMNVYYYHVPSP